jgi:hypothetical protein
VKHPFSYLFISSSLAIRLESITACASIKSDFSDISLIYWEDLADLGAALLINSAKLFLGQHGATKKKRAASTALVTFPSS